MTNTNTDTDTEISQETQDYIAQELIKDEERPILHVGFTGTRRTPPNRGFAVRFDQVEKLLEDYVYQSPRYRLICHHGDCRGGDFRFHEIAKCIAETVPNPDPSRTLSARARGRLMRVHHCVTKRTTQCYPFKESAD